MKSLSVQFLYRPLRVGWCVAAGDWTAFRKAVRYSFTMWGGRYNPIIPVDDQETADDLVRTFRADLLIGLTNSAAANAFIERHPERRNPFRHEQLFSPTGNGGSRAAIVDITHPIARIYEENFRRTPPEEPKLDIYRWQDDDPLANAFACEFGALPPVAETGTDYEAQARDVMRGADSVIAPGGPAAAYHPDRLTIAGLNRAYMNRHYVVQNHWEFPGFYLGEADNFHDLVNFWNLRAAAVPVQFHDPRYANRMAQLRLQWIARIGGAGTAPGRPGGATVWHRFDRPENPEELASLGAVAGRVRVRQGIWNGRNVRAPIMYFDQDQALATIDSSDEGTAITFATPVKPFVGMEGNWRQHYVVSVSPGIGLYGDEQATLWTPFLPELNEFFGRNVHYRWDHARAEPESIGIIRQISDRSLTIKALDVAKLVGEIFGTVGIDAKISKSGRVAAILLQQMGGLGGCRVFKIGGVRKLIEDHRPDRHFDRATAAETIRGHHTDHPLKKYEMIYFQPREHGQELTKDMVLSYLLDRGVFRAGLAFTCPHCQLDFWRSLDEARSKLNCEYCGREINVSSQLRDKAWAFRRSGLFGRDDHQEGAIPVLLTIMALNEMHLLQSTLFAMAMDLKPKTAPIQACETDFVLVCPAGGMNDKIDVVIGECKTRKEITAEDVAHLKAVADVFPSEKFNIFVVFSRLTPFTQEEIQRIRTVNNPGRQRRAIMLTARELEPWYPYEETAKEFEIDRSVASYEDMTNATDIVFFQNRRRQPVAGGEGPQPVQNQPA